ncbi:MAG TPA: HU family DNA-binding protein [Methylomirabilota bacterium]|jgi:integration host factor subunit beta
MNKSDLIREVARVSGLTRELSDTIVTAVFERITEALMQGERVELRGLGTFAIRQRRARLGRNPKTGAGVNVPARRVPVFKMGKELQAILNPRLGAEPAPAPEPAKVNT